MGDLQSHGSKVPPYFFKPDQKIGFDVYYNVLRYTMLPWLKATYPDNIYVWQQDGVPAIHLQKCKSLVEPIWQASGLRTFGLRVYLV